jgi:hypothetical protein
MRRILVRYRLQAWNRSAPVTEEVLAGAPVAGFDHALTTAAR